MVCWQLIVGSFRLVGLADFEVEESGQEKDDWNADAQTNS